MSTIDLPPLKNSNGVTIKELKDFVKNLPEQNENGEPFEVWISSGEGVSSISKSVWKLNKGDLLIES